MIEINSVDEYVKALKENNNLVVDFWAPWCGPCKALAPVLERVSNDYPDVTFVKVNIDENRALAQNNNVTSIPTLKYFKEGQAVATQVGMSSLTQIEEKVNSLL